MTLATITTILPFAVFFLTVLTVVAKGSRKWGRAGGVMRAVLAVFYAAFVVTGVGGLVLSIWLVVAGGGKAMLLLVLLVPLSLFLISTGTSLFRFVMSPLPEAAKPLVTSTGWSDLGDAAERARNGGVAPHLRVDALRKSGSAE